MSHRIPRPVVGDEAKRVERGLRGNVIEHVEHGRLDSVTGRELRLPNGPVMAVPRE